MHLNQWLHEHAAISGNAVMMELTQEPDMNTKELVADLGIAATVEQSDTNPHMDDDRNPMDHWRVQLKHSGRTMTVYFSMGHGHNGKAPEAADVLDCLASDAAGVENAAGFADWASEYGYDTDSRKAEKTYKVCQREAKRLRQFMGERYEDLLWNTERI